jgi:hypothetical protein
MSFLIQVCPLQMAPAATFGKGKLDGVQGGPTQMLRGRGEERELGSGAGSFGTSWVLVLDEFMVDILWTSWLVISD